MTTTSELELADHTELYDHDQDPEELHDVAGENPKIVKELSSKLKTIGKPRP